MASVLLCVNLYVFFYGYVKLGTINPTGAVLFVSITKHY